MPAPNVINAAMLNVLIEQMAQGKIQPFSMLGSVSQGQPIRLGDWRGEFRKDGPGVFQVLTYEGDSNEPITRIQASSPVEAKMTLLDLAKQQWQRANEDKEKRE